MNDSIFVTGASGKLGRLVVGHLLDTERVAPSRIVAGTRTPEALADLAARGVSVRRADFDDAAGLEQAFAGAGTVLIVSTDALDGAGTRLRQHETAIAAAVRAGAARLAYTSLVDADTSHVSFAPDHAGTESAMAATGLPHLVFRNTWYQENLFMSLPQALRSGQWFTSAGDGRTAYVSRDDIAAAIAAALANPPSASATWTLTGAEALTNADVAALASEVTGRPIAVVNLTDEQLGGGMKAAGVPEAVIPTLVSFETAARHGDLARVTSDVETLSRRRPRALRDFLVANRDALAG